MRTPMIAGNWKMNGTLAEARELAAALRKNLDDTGGAEVVVCPPFTALAAVREALEGSRIGLGAQDLHWEAKGAFTGEVSPTMLRDTGCRYAILGHSERRHILGETNEMVNKKVRAALAHELVPIVCVGELLEERNMKVTKEVVERQITRAFEGLETRQMSSVVAAYEPVWAIGTGMTATPRAAQDVHHFIRNLVSRLFGSATAETVRILYGGSVKPDNINNLMEQEDIDGALVGGASLDVHSFVPIVRYKG